MRITISGGVGMGKTTAGRIIAAALREHGWNVEHIEGPADHPPAPIYKSVQIEERSTVHD